MSPTKQARNPAPEAEPPSRRLLALPAGFALLLAAFGTLPQIRENARYLGSFLGAAGALLAWTAALWLKADGRTLKTHFVLRRPHWLQPLVQGAVYIYWGMHWPQVKDVLWLLPAQVAFAYAFDMLLAWSRQDDYELGLGILPIVFSINLFLWFKPDWFFFQFLLVAAGFAVKQLVRWDKDGRRAHIFNPSSFPLAIASLLLIVTGTAHWTWGPEIAVSIGYPNRIYAYLFLISIPGQILFGVASMTMPAAITAAALGAVYYGFTGTYFYFGPIPTAAFLGMLLLFTDPATAPKSELGRVLYGMLYGASVFVLYGVLDFFGELTFYDKLLFVPFLNLSVQALDRIAQRPWLARLDPSAYLKGLAGRARNLAWTGTWAASFGLMLVLHGVGDNHPANRLPFWRDACDRGLRNGCRNLMTMETTLCDKGAGWACNEAGITFAKAPEELREGRDAQAFERGCNLGFRPACFNGHFASMGTNPLQHAAPRAEDYTVLLDTKNDNHPRTTLELWQLACTQGWREGCASLERVTGGGRRSPQSLAADCQRGEVQSCQELGLMYRRGDGVPMNDQRALACELGVSAGCIAP